MDAKMVTSALELPGHTIIDNVGIVRGIVVRSRSIVGNFFGGLQTILGGNITVYTSMCERARKDAYPKTHAVTHVADLIRNVINSVTMMGLEFQAAQVRATSSGRSPGRWSISSTGRSGHLSTSCWRSTPSSRASQHPSAVVFTPDAAVPADIDP